MDTPRGPAVPLIGLLLLGMTFATGILAGHLCVDVIAALQASAEEEHRQAEPDAQQDLPAWRARLLDPWPGRERASDLAWAGASSRDGRVVHDG